MNPSREDWICEYHPFDVVFACSSNLVLDLFVYSLTGTITTKTTSRWVSADIHVYTPSTFVNRTCEVYASPIYIRVRTPTPNVYLPINQHHSHTHFFDRSGILFVSLQRASVEDGGMQECFEERILQDIRHTLGKANARLASFFSSPSLSLLLSFNK